MSNLISRVTVDTEDEKKILITSITDTNFLKAIQPIMKEEFFHLPLSRKIWSWITTFYEKHKQAPGRHIQDIFQIERAKLESVDQDLIELMLLNLSDQYEEQHNTQYLIDNAEIYLRGRAIDVHIEKIKSLRTLGHIDEAEQEIAHFNRTSLVTSEAIAINPHDPDFIRKAFETVEKNNLFKLPGALGELLGILCRNWLIICQAAYKRGKCVKYDTKILLSNGQLKTIKEIVENRNGKVVSLNNKKKFQKSAITDFYDNGIKPCYKVSTRTGRFVEVTLNHPFLTPTGWKELSSLSSGNYIALPKKLEFFGNVSLPEHKLKLLAYLIADGCITGNYIQFTKKLKEIQYDVKRCCELMGDNLEPFKGCNWEFGISRKKQILGRNGRSSNTREWLYDIGVNNEKSIDKKLPEIVFELTKKDLSIFLRTLFTCDGSIYGKKLPEIEYSSSSKEMIYQISHLLTRFGIIHKVDKKKVKLNGKEFIGYNLSIRSKRYVLLFLNEIGFEFEKFKKSESYRDVLKNISSFEKFLDVFPNEYVREVLGKKVKGGLVADRIRSGMAINRETLGKIAYEKGDVDLINDYESDIFWDKIISIEYIGDHQTYDLTINKNHNFVANNMLIHNTWNFQILRNAAILNRLRVIDLNHEMSEEELAMRHWKGVTGLGDVAGNYEIPVFDCLLNQTGQCNKSFRKNDVALFNPEDEETKPSFKRSPKGYKACDHCRKVPELRQYYVQEVWKTTVIREGLSPEKVVKRVSALNKMIGDRVRFKSFPRGTANVNKDTRRTLEMLADQGWIADVVLDDYGDIHAPEDARRAKNDEIKLNDTTLAQAGLASEWHLLYCTASQINKAALKHKSGKMGDASGSTRAAYAHPAFVYSINQTEQEEEMDAKRINIVARRFGKKSAMKEVLFLQALELGQALLDSEWIDKNS